MHAGSRPSRSLGSESGTTTRHHFGGRGRTALPGTCWTSGWPRSSGRLPPWPEHALVGAGDGADALVRELLHAFSLVRLRRIEIALRVRGDAVHCEELARLAATIAEAREDLERLTIHDVHALVLAVREEQVLLLRVA